MCGIAGILDPGGVAESDLWTMGRSLAHRGPDDASADVDGPLGFAFRRLSIIDLEGGAQPIANEDGSVRVVLNGEIYNFRNIRRRLERRGHQFSTRTDTEVLVHLYEEKGAGLVEELRGMFAFAIWDRRERRLLLARDHLGQKPLYWARHGRRFYFASEIKAILAVDPGFRNLDRQALHDYLTLRIVVDPRSMFDGVRKLPPAHILEVKPGEEPRIQRYWNLAFEPKRPLSEDEALERLDETVRETVRVHLVSDVEVGALLSGGVDSGLVTAMMAEHLDGPFKTFAGSTPYEDFDEAPVARTVSELFGTQHRETTISGDLIRQLPVLVDHLDEPSDPLSLCIYQISELASQEVKVVLGGDGGDELFGGYDRYYGAKFAKYFALLPEALREQVIGRLLRWAPDGFWYKSFSHRLRWLNELASVDQPRRYARSLSYFYFTPDLRDQLYTETFRRSVDSHDPEAAIAFWQSDEGAHDALDRMLLADTMVRLPNHPVMIMDRMSMAHGLEARSPFLDHRLTEFVARLEPRLKIRGTRRRYLEMRLAERYLPPAVVNRPKQGFSSAVPYLMREQFQTLFEHFLPQSRLIQAGLLRPEPIQRILHDHLDRRTDHGNRLWLLLNAELWYRVCIEDADVGDLQLEIGDILNGRNAVQAASSASSGP